MRDYSKVIEERNIWICVLLCFVTCGIYFLYWVYKLDEDWNMITENEGQAPGTNPGMVIILSIVTCSFYLIYFWYKLSKRASMVKDRNGNGLEDDSVICMILQLIGCGFASAAIQQNKLNLYVKYGM